LSVLNSSFISEMGESRASSARFSIADLTFSCVTMEIF